MPQFEAAGQYKVTVLDAYFAESKFNKNTTESVDVCLHVRDTISGSEGYWSGEYSQRHGVGNNADKTQKDMTLDALESVGWEHGQDLRDETLQTMVGREIAVGVTEREHNGKTYYDVKYLGATKFAPKKIQPHDVAARLAAINGVPNTTTTTQAATPTTTPQPPAANPFA